MPSTLERADRAKKDDTPFVGTVVHESEARKKYEETISEWVAGRASYEDVVAQDPYRHTRSILGFFIYLLSGKTGNRNR